MRASRVNVLQLTSDALSVALLPDDGCDIYSIVDRASGIDVLWKAPWGPRAAASHLWVDNSESHWLSRLSGGWQLLLPHAGKECTIAGTVRGFHGEAGVTAWQIESVGADEAVLSVRLMTAPLFVRRRVAIEGLSLVLDEEVTNESPDPAAFSWGHHPTFGAPLLAANARIEIPATTLLQEGETVPRRWPTIDGVDRSVVPMQPHASLSYLQGLEEGVYRLINDKIGLGVQLRWPIETFPHVWLWQELRATAGYPWFRRAYAMGIEPHTTVPQGGFPGLELAGGERRTARLELRVLHQPTIVGTP